ncbi:hypothetical protein T440DRAFT_470974 [Plenodomus tracheiphilus IPT5]|uniref:Mitochondrial carrier n=1 Tax=Plenodomus tracheiphilus IPT5 TaxID=1408161 RepID=A0A6A7AZ71_9PLEO|nr:hypothetical protein T440DRAFT_470974 [Plenodomus tracheiphilus IPT5]
MPSRTLISAMRPTRTLRAPTTIGSRRTLTTTSRRSIKEDADRTPEQVEKAKQEQLKEQQQGQGRWREDLASSGESNIAADKEQVNDHDSHMKDLQKETASKGEKGQI